MDDRQGSEEISKGQWWEQQLERWRSSGLSMRGYCRREGISFNGLRYWKAKIQGGPSRRRAVKLPASLAATVDAAQLIEVVVADRFTVKVPHGFEGSEFQRLVRSLEALR